MLRYNMRWVSGSITVAEEIEYICNYVALINLRYDFSIRLSLRIPDEVMGHSIPKMSLQPIVENAIEHGLEPDAADAYIYIKAVLDTDACRIEVTDPGRGMDEAALARLSERLASARVTEEMEGMGVGLKNVHDRLRLAYGGEFGLTVISRRGFYTKVIVRLPPCDTAAREGGQEGGQHRYSADS